MAFAVTSGERAALAAAEAGERRVRHWRRYRALRLLADGRSPAAVAAAVGRGERSVWNWLAAWRREGLAGLVEPPRPGRARALDARAEALLEGLLGSDPQARGHHATGWTVPLLRAELAGAGYAVGPRTVRRALHRLGWRWKRPKYVLGRPDPAYGEKKPPSRGGRPRS
jgi:transposase